LNQTVPTEPPAVESGIPIPRKLQKRPSKTHPSTVSDEEDEGDITPADQGLTPEILADIEAHVRLFTWLSIVIFMQAIRYTTPS
jgi:hypothetical protein